MKLSLRLRALVAVLILSAVPALAQGPNQGARPFPWWKSDAFKKDLGLTTEQSARIDRIWETTRPELRQAWDELSNYEAKLSRLIQNDADEATLTRMIDRVETSRATANKTRSLMLVQMVKVLTPDQRARFGALHDKWAREQGLTPVLPLPGSPGPPRTARPQEPGR